MAVCVLLFLFFPIEFSNGQEVDSVAKVNVYKKKRCPDG